MTNFSSLQKICRTKTLSFGLLFIFIFSLLSASSSFPKKAEAAVPLAVPVNDFLGNTLTAKIAGITLLQEGYIQSIAIKQTGPTPGVPVPFTSLDSIMKLAVKMLIKQMTSSIVQWINSGFNGNPSFVSNPAQFFTGVADRTAGAFIEGSQLAFLCSPFGLDIRLALGLKYFSSFSRDTIGCTLSDVIGNVQGFANFTKGGDFSGGGGWNSWLQLTTEPQNNPYGALLLADSEMRVQIAGKTLIEAKQLDWGKGFLSFTKCYEYAPAGSAGPREKGQGADEANCLDKRIVTPGTAIESQLNQTLGSDLRQYELAKSFDDIISALANQLIGQALSATGLLGASQSSNSFDGKSFIERLQAQKASCDGIEGTADCTNSLIATSTTVAPVPLPELTEPIPVDIPDSGGLGFQNDKIRPALAIQTSTLIDRDSGTQYDANQAIDGSTSVAGSYGFSSTAGGKPGDYWQTDLGATEYVKQIDLYQRLVNPIANVDILISNDPSFKNVQPFKKLNGAQNANPISIQINPLIQARYIRIVQRDGSYLILAEVVPYRNVKPVIIGANNSVNLTVGATFDPLSGVTAKDLEDGDIPPSRIVLGGTFVDTKTPGAYTITYDVTDLSGVPADPVQRTVTVK